MSKRVNHSEQSGETGLIDHDGEPVAELKALSKIQMKHQTLLVSLGTSPAIVPEAFLLPDHPFQTVRVLTTASVPPAHLEFILHWFESWAPEVELSITRVAGFQDFRSEQDHFTFEEVLYRWILHSGTRPDQRWICLSGGFKTMSAAMQKAAAVLGAAGVFHVLADSCCQTPDGRSRPPESAEEIQLALETGHLHWIQLGAETGWPQLRSTRPDEFPLTDDKLEGKVRWVRSPDHAFRLHLNSLIDRSHRIAGSWERLSELPFTELATWSQADLAWLGSSVDPSSEQDRQWVARLPKVELHCHLGGFATHGPLLDEVRAAAKETRLLPPLQHLPLPVGWPIPTHAIGLEPYCQLGDNNGSKLLRDEGCLRRQCQLLYQHLMDQGIHYAEIRCSPANYADPSRQRSPWKVLEDIKNTFDTCRREAVARMEHDPSQPVPCQVNLLIVATRKLSGDYRAHIARHLALAVTAAENWTHHDDCRVVGVDLAGFEDVNTRAHYFREEFTAVHRCGLALTVHAGENDDAEGIWRAVFDLNARRLGHALRLRDSPDLLRSVVDRGIAIEMCPFANLQICGFPLDNPPADLRHRYPLLDYLRAGARVTVNTDNIGISAASLTDNLLLAARLCPGLTRLDLLCLQRNALDSAFIPSAVRTQTVQRLTARIPRP